MPQLTPEGHRIAGELAQRHGFSVDAVEHMMISMLSGNGSMAQFSHAEFGGYGQWMRGGMLMLGDMFNSSLKGRVDSLCNDIANILVSQPHLLRTGSFQSQSQSGGVGSAYQMQHGSPTGVTTAASMAGSLFQPDPTSQWWPAELGSPNATGAQNNVKYAYFGDKRRLAVDTHGEVWIYDTGDHQIGGFSQQQGSGGSIAFSSQYGTVNLGTLQVVSRNGRPVETPVAHTSPVYNPASTPAFSQSSASQSSGGLAESDVFAALEKLGDLKAKGILTDEEFRAKKAELLSRL